MILDGQKARLAEVHGNSEAVKKIAIIMALAEYESLILSLIETMIDDWETKVGDGTYSLGLRRLADEIRGVSSV